jgi:hypothetical protein
MLPVPKHASSRSYFRFVCLFTVISRNITFHLIGTFHCQLMTVTGTTFVFPGKTSLARWISTRTACCLQVKRISNQATRYDLVCSIKYNIKNTLLIMCNWNAKEQFPLYCTIGSIFHIYLTNLLIPIEPITF